MVVFICDGCQESLNRGKVKAHLAKCRNAHSLSCVDCGTRFEGDTYDKHITCVSESEKYAGARDPKQDDWVDTVQQALQNISDPGAKSAFESMISKIGENTVPRKKQKFVNMCKSSHGYIRPPAVDAIWSSVEAVLKRKAEEREKKKQKELAAKKERQEEQAKATAEAAAEEEKKLRKKLKKALKKSEEKVILLSDAMEQLGCEKKILKRVAKHFNDTFELEKNENGKRVIKLARIDGEDEN